MRASIEIKPQQGQSEPLKGPSVVVNPKQKEDIKIKLKLKPKEEIIKEEDKGEKLGKKLFLNTIKLFKDYT